MIIYKVSNKINNKEYIGQTSRTLKYRKLTEENKAKISAGLKAYFAKLSYNKSGDK